MSWIGTGGGRSSFRIVPTACVSPGSKPVMFEMSTENVSSGSTVVSPLTATSKV
jgi:hypothetical protein